MYSSTSRGVLIAAGGYNRRRSPRAGRRVVRAGGRPGPDPAPLAGTGGDCRRSRPAVPADRRLSASAPPLRRKHQRRTESTCANPTNRCSLTPAAHRARHVCGGPAPVARGPPPQSRVGRLLLRRGDARFRSPGPPGTRHPRETGLPGAPAHPPRCSPACGSQPRQELVADPVARDARRPDSSASSRQGRPSAREKSLDLRPPRIEQWPDDRPGSRMNAGEAGRAGAAQEAQQDRLGLVVHRVRDADAAGAEPGRRIVQERVSDGPGGVLDRGPQAPCLLRDHRHVRRRSAPAGPPQAAGRTPRPRPPTVAAGG